MDSLASFGAQRDSPSAELFNLGIGGRRCTEISSMDATASTSRRNASDSNQRMIGASEGETGRSFASGRRPAGVDGALGFQPAGGDGLAARGRGRQGSLFLFVGNSMVVMPQGNKILESEDCSARANSGQQLPHAAVENSPQFFVTPAWTWRANVSPSLAPSMTMRLKAFCQSRLFSAPLSSANHFDKTATPVGSAPT